MCSRAIYGTMLKKHCRYIWSIAEINRRHGTFVAPVTLLKHGTCKSMVFGSYQRMRCPPTNSARCLALSSQKLHWQNVIRGWKGVGLRAWWRGNSQLNTAPPKCTRQTMAYSRTTLWSSTKTSCVFRLHIKIHGGRPDHDGTPGVLIWAPTISVPVDPRQLKPLSVNKACVSFPWCLYFDMVIAILYFPCRVSVESPGTIRYSIDHS